MYGLYQIMYFTLIDMMNTLMSPFFLFIFVIIAAQYYREEEKKSIGRCIFKAFTSAVYGVLGGFIATIAFIYLEVVIVPYDFMMVLIAAIGLSIINPRFMCFAYGGSLISIISIFFHLKRIDIQDIMLMVATMHMVESILIILNGQIGKRVDIAEYNGELVGGTFLNRFWPVPFVIFAGDGLIKPITLMGILAYSDFTVSYPRKKNMITGFILLIYSLILMMLTRRLGGHILSPIFAITGHELIIQISQLREKRKEPFFSLPIKGARIIGVYRWGIGKKLGMRAGDIVLNINDVIINSEKDIEAVEKLNQKMIRIKYFSNKRGLVNKIYMGNKKTLGIKVIPKVPY